MREKSNQMEEAVDEDSTVCVQAPIHSIFLLSFEAVF